MIVNIENRYWTTTQCPVAVFLNGSVEKTTEVFEVWRNGEKVAVLKLAPNGSVFTNKPEQK